jgi:hypothetical protein
LPADERRRVAASGFSVEPGQLRGKADFGLCVETGVFQHNPPISDINARLRKKHLQA